MSRIVGYDVDGKRCCRHCLARVQSPQGEGEPILNIGTLWKYSICTICLKTLNEADWCEVPDKVLMAAFSIIAPGAADGMARANGTVGVSINFLKALLSECLTHDVNDEWGRSAISNLRNVIGEA